jgi:plasmid stabilization system protein ParE
MRAWEFTPRAKHDLFEIWDYIAKDNPQAADRVAQAIFLACELLSNSPLAGKVREDLAPAPLRFWLVHPYVNYCVVYNPESKPLQIIRIIHGARDLASSLR